MSVGALGDLVIKLSADMATFQSSMEKAAYVSEQNAKRIDAALGVVKAGFAGLGVGLSIAGVAAFVRGGIEAEAALARLSERTGATVETLSALKGVAKVTGTEMDTVGAGVAKLSRSMLESVNGSGKASQAFESLGISVTDSNGQLKASDTVIVDVAKKLAGMENATQRVAYAQQIFGKSGAELLPFLLKLAETGELNAKVTSEQAEQAKRFEESMIRLTNQSGQLKIQLANALLPSLNAITESMLLAKSAGEGFFGSFVAGAKAAIQEMMRWNNRGDLNKVSEEMVKKTDLILSLERRQERNPDNFTAQRIKILRDEVGELGRKRDTLEGIVALEKPGAITGAKPKGTQNALPSAGGDGIKDRAEKERAALQSLQEQLGAIGHEMSEVDKVIGRVTEGTWRDFSEAGKANVLAVAGEIDNVKSRAEQFKSALESGAAERAAIEEEQRTYNDHARRQAEIIENLKQKYIALIDPIEKYRKELVEIDALEAAGNLSAQQALEARFLVQEQIEKAMQGTQDQTKKTDNFARDLGLTFSSAFEKAAAGGARLSEVLNGLQQDIAKIILRKTITEPLGNSLTDMLKGGAGKGITEWFSGLFGGGKAGGGSVAGGTPYLVGERGPELFVPGGNGAIVPNNAMGGAINVTFAPNINAIDTRSGLAILLSREGQSAITGVISAAMRRAGRTAQFG